MQVLHRFSGVFLHTGEKYVIIIAATGRQKIYSRCFGSVQAIGSPSAENNLEIEKEMEIMGLFDMFKKKNCDICGGEIGLLGNRKLEDGNCCKKCAAKLSPWFSDRRESTVEQIKEQLAYRAQNAEELKSFQVSEVIGEYEKMYIEKVDGIPTRFFVTSDSSYLEENPDIIPFADVLSCLMDIDENEEELMRENKDGEEVSYDPPRFAHHYNFYIDMVIRNNPWFDAIRFNVNEDTVTLETIRSSVGRSAFPVKNPAANREADRYSQYEQICKKICQTVEDAKQGVLNRKAAAAAAEAAGPVICPACGARTNAGQFCEYCGSRLG